ncbi:unnamed protein product, partial [Urochloa humidicola]
PTQEASHVEKCFLNPEAKQRHITEEEAQPL